MGSDINLIHFPIHHIIFSQLYFLSDSVQNYLSFYFYFSLVIPFLFYLNLVQIFKDIDKKVLILISSLIYIFPTFQYTAIWGNSHITSLFFFLIGTLNHLKFRESNFDKKIYFFVSIIFLTLAAYTKQYYVFFFFFIFLEFFLKLKLKTFLLFSTFTFLLSIPGFLFLIENPLVFFGVKQKTTNFVSSILISSSICFFYIVPILVQFVINDFKNLKNMYKKIFDLKIFIISLIILFSIIPLFYYDSKIGGGIIYKLFVNVLNQKSLFFISSFFGIYFTLFFTQKNIYSYLLSLLILITFSTGYFIFQKYFEPMFFIILLLYFDKIKIEKSINKNNHFSIIYFSSYYLIANYIYFLGV